MNTKFADHVTSLSFNLSLSKSMVICLVEIAELGDYAAYLDAPKEVLK